MKFVTLNNSMNGHQIALADALYKELGDDFVFIEYGRPVHQYGRAVNNNNDVLKRSYVINLLDSEENCNKAIKLINEADVVRASGNCQKFIKQRVKLGKLTFWSSERYFKPYSWYLKPRYIASYVKKFIQYRILSNTNFRLLCQSAYLSDDCSALGIFKNRRYRFAYFVNPEPINIQEVLSSKEDGKIRFVWCARFIDWKHPELPVLLAEKLIQNGKSNFVIEMIGADVTPLWKSIKQMVETKNLTEHVILTGALLNEEVKQHMRNSHIFLFTSDRNEGWGVVLNEAMGAGCACVASNEIGAAPYLIKDKENGMLFKSNNIDSLYECVLSLYDNKNLRDTVSANAYATMTGLWSSENAAKRLIELSNSIINRNELLYIEGPCSQICRG